jgi:hypothetical protein
MKEYITVGATGNKQEKGVFSWRVSSQVFLEVEGTRLKTSK